MNAFVPPNWKEVSIADFEKYLETCPDYTRDAYANFAKYHFRHNGQYFAAANRERVFVDPSLLGS